MKKTALILLAALLCTSLLACTAQEGQGNELDNYIPPVTTAKIDTGTLTFEEGPSESAIITKYDGLAQNHAVVIPSVINDREVSAIGKEAFFGLNQITDIQLPDTIQYIDDNAFAGCTSLKTIVIPASVTRIGKLAFQGCTSLETIIFEGQELESIESSAFHKCISLKNMILPEGLKSIGDYAFAHCRSLTSIKTPKSIEHIGIFAFYACEGLNSEGAIDLSESLSLKDSIVDDEVIPGIGEFAFNTEKSDSNVNDSGEELYNMNKNYIKTAPDSYAWQYIIDNTFDHVFTTFANKCDVCGEITTHDCKDAGEDGKCDLCGEDMSVS